MSVGGTETEADPRRPGPVLRERREALEVSVREVAETLNLSMSIVEALEADDAERLPGTVFARGYVRAYARLLDLDPEPLLAYYPKAEALAPQAEVPSEPPIWEWIRQRPGLVLGGAGGVLALMLVLIAVLLWPDGSEPAPAEISADAAGIPSAAGADSGEAAGAAAGDAASGVRLAEGPAAQAEAASPAEVPPAGQPTQTAEDAVATLADAAPAPAAGPAAAAGPAPEPPSSTDGETDTALSGGVALPPATDFPGAALARETAPADRDDGNARRITEAGEDRLAFTFSDDCWVEVKSASGTNLYSDLNRAGAELALVGQGPFRILLGYAPGAKLVFNGEPVPLAPHTRNNVATLVLGQ
ncbi:MAG: hypothetical protein CMQ43_04895 [Gammaproteobacteria bacterium]|nr:hypothetical protein [Gammaproteobacteria bacterium]